MNYRIAYNFLNIELNCPNVEELKPQLSDKGFTNLCPKPKKNDPEVPQNKLWIVYRYNFIVPVSTTEEALIRTDKWFQNAAPVLNSNVDIGLVNWFPIYVVPMEKFNLEKLDAIFNKAVSAGSAGLTSLTWTLFTDTADQTYRLLINNGLVSLAKNILDLKRLKEILDLADASVVLEAGRNIEVI
jgi:hypothetical protein